MRASFTHHRSTVRAHVALAAIAFLLASCATPPRASQPPSTNEGGSARAYGATPGDARDEERRLAARLFGSGRAAPAWDDALSIAAGELAARVRGEGRASLATDSEEIRLAQARAGAVMADFRPLVVLASTAAAAQERLRQTVADLPADPEHRWRMGLGIAQGADRTAIVLLLATAGVDLEPLPSRISIGEERLVAGRLVALEAPAIHVTPPKGRPREVAVEVDRSGRFYAPLRFDAAGVWWVEILGRGKRGPAVAALLPVHVGTPIAARAASKGEPPEPADVAGKERVLADEANRLRRSRGLAPLLVDPVLAKVARAYAEELRATGRFAHVSERSGDVGARLRAAGYRYDRAGENLAHTSTAARAHRSLVQSPAHLAVLTDPAWREAGFGVAIVDDPPGVIVVEVFARPADR
ncbi:MAG TPA: CAP domain-containing protein [Vulgatibacter sp.]